MAEYTQLQLQTERYIRSTYFGNYPTKLNELYERFQKNKSDVLLEIKIKINFPHGIKLFNEQILEVVQDILNKEIEK